MPHRWSSSTRRTGRRATFGMAASCARSTPTPSGSCAWGGETWPFFLEWERRAVRPVTMAARLAPYLRYYASHRPTDDHGDRPAVLVVFDDELAASHFLRVAWEGMDRAGVTVPLRVSDKRLLRREGPLGRAWVGADTRQHVRLCR